MQLKEPSERLSDPSLASLPSHPAAVSSPALEAVKSGLETHDLVVINFYRGQWCTVCKSWLNKYLKTPKYTELRGKVRVLSIAISSEAEAKAATTQKVFGLEGVEDFVFCNDPENKVADILNEKLAARVVIDKKRPSRNTNYEKYDNGFTQSATVALQAGADGEWTKLYSWSSVPSILNRRGVFGRTTPTTALAGILSALDATQVATRAT